MTTPTPAFAPAGGTLSAELPAELPAQSPVPAANVQLKRELRAAEMRKRAAAIALIAPLAIFLLVTFVVPIAILLKRAVDNPEVANALPKTVVTLAGWNRTGTPEDPAYEALAADLLNAREQGTLGAFARRINTEIPGARSIIMKTARALPLQAPEGTTLSAAQTRSALLEIDEKWGQPDYWQVIAANSSRQSPYYLLASLDLKQDVDGRIHQVDSDQSAYRQIFGRTFEISLVVTLFCLVIAYPLAYWLSTMSERRANLFMILVRVAAWMVLLQSEGLVNKTLITLGIVGSPLELLFNRTGTYISMTHILLPFMILPLYSVMKSIPPTFVRAAVSLGSHPFAAFWRVYVPQTYPGIGAGALLVFILALGYYITPSLLGGASEQMVSYYVAYFINVSINWGMACALGALLLVATLLLYSVYRRFAKLDISMG